MLAARPPNWRGVEQSGLAGVEDIVLIKSDSTKKEIGQQKEFFHYNDASKQPLKSLT